MQQVTDKYAYCTYVNILWGPLYILPITLILYYEALLQLLLILVLITFCIVFGVCVCVCSEPSLAYRDLWLGHTVVKLIMFSRKWTLRDFGEQKSLSISSVISNNCYSIRPGIYIPSVLGVHSTFSCSVSLNYCPYKDIL